MKMYINCFLPLFANVSRQATSIIDLFGKNGASLISLTESMLSGWLPEYPATAYALTETERKKALSGFQEAMENWPYEKLSIESSTGEVVVVTAAEVKAMAAFVVTDKSMYALSAGNCRSIAVLVAMAVEKKNEKAYGEIPCIVKKYANAAERCMDNIRSNSLDKNTRLQVTDLDYLSAGSELFSLGAAEVKLWKGINSAGMNRGTAQKVFATCRADARFPEEKIVEKCLSGELPYRQYDKEKVRLLTVGSMDKKVKPASKKVVMSYLMDPSKENGNEPKMMSKKDIEKFRDSTKVAIVRVLLTAILENNSYTVPSLNTQWEPLNAAYAAIGGTEPETETETEPETEPETETEK